MGRMQRTKGKTFERAIAAKVRLRWPSALVRRASQAERADNPDVFIEGEPALERLWLELQDARAPTPLVKLEQAERDATSWRQRRTNPPVRWPVVVWHRLNERTTYATLRLQTLIELAAPRAAVADRRELVTVSVDEFFELVASVDTAAPG